MDTVVIGALATVVAALVAGLTGRATARASAKGAVQAAQVTSLAKIEEGAAQRAAAVYEGAIARLEAERAEDRAEIEDLEAKRREDRSTIAALQRQVDGLQREVRECRTLCRRLAERRGTDS